ncbi:hypothetical protein BASA81_011318 [Batrachochytrium salamandrivorans]|nr:hypothetical protein BASA81_011318 [Batrachochytrium salamandrivorans]
MFAFSRRRSSTVQRGEINLPPQPKAMSSEDAKREALENQGPPLYPTTSSYTSSSSSPGGEDGGDGEATAVRKTTSRRISQTQFGKPIKELPMAAVRRS